jgi:hypothetical protein
MNVTLWFTTSFKTRENFTSKFKILVYRFLIKKKIQTNGSVVNLATSFNETSVELFKTINYEIRGIDSINENLTVRVNGRLNGIYDESVLNITFI